MASTALTTSSSPLLVLFNLLKTRLIQHRPKTGAQKALFATLAILLALVAKYPNRAIGTKARPDLADIEWNGKPLVGNTIAVIRGRHQFLENIVDNFEKTGKDVMTSTMLGLGRVIAINNPELLEHILKTNFENYEKGYILNDTLKPVLGNGIFNTDGAIWRMHRKTASHVFSTKIYRALIDGAFKDHSLELCAVLEDACQAGQPVDLQTLFLRLTLDAFAKLSFGLDINSQGKDGQDPFGTAFDFAVVETDMRFLNPLWKLTDRLTSKLSKMNKAIEVIDSYAYLAIKNRHSETEAEAKVRQISGREDLLDLFMKYRDEDGRALSDLELRDVFINFIIAGRDTTAQALSWSYYEIMMNSQVEANLVQEALRVDTSALTYEVLMQDMPYSTAVFMESLRLYPPVPRNLKTAVADDTLPNGIKVHAGDKIMFSTYAIGRNKSVWGPQACEFLPERWFEGSETLQSIEKGTIKNSDTVEGRSWPRVKKESNYKFSSFNAGPRLCLGKQLATLEALTIMQIVTSRYKFTLVPGQSVPKAVPSLTLPMKNPLMVNVTRRV